MSYQVGNIEVSLITRMDEVDKKINGVLADLKKLKSGISQNKNEIEKTDKSAKKLDKNLKKAFNVGKLYVAFNYARRYAAAMGKVVKSSIDYLETINKFKVSMNGMYKEALKFQNKLTENFGLSKAIMMDYQANFNNIIKGLGGISDTTAEKLSETLTEMSIDFSSLFNVPIERATSAFQAALTQQVRPIRSVSGFDTTEKSLQNTLKMIGINDRRISQLSQVEKRLLIIITLQRQMQSVGAEADFSRTIEQPANQLKVMVHTMKDLMIAFGNFALHGLAPIFKYINGILMAAKAIIQVISFGKFGDIGKENKGINLETALNTGGAVKGIGKAKKAMKELKNATLGIDELNIIEQPKDTGGGDDGGGAGGLGGVDSRLLGALGDYNSKLSDTLMEATKIRDRIMEWLGFTNMGTDSLGNTIWQLDEGITRFGIIKGILATIGVIIATYFTYKSISGIVKGARLLKSLFGAHLISTLTKVAKILSKFKFGRTFLSGIKNLTGTGFLSKIGQVFALVKGGAGSFREALGTVFPIFGKLKKVPGLIIKGITKVATFIGVKGLAIMAIIALVVGAIIGVVYAIKHWDEIKVYLSKFGEWCKEKWNDFKNWCKEKWENFKSKVEEKVDKLVEWFKGKWESIKNWFKEKWAVVKEWFKNLPYNIGVVLGKAYGKVEEWINSVVEWFATLPEKIKEKLDLFKEKIIEWGENVKTWFTETLPEVLTHVAEWFATLPDKIKEKLDAFKEKITEWKENVKTWFTETLPEILTHVAEWFATLPDKIKEKLDAFKEKITEWKDNMKEWFSEKLPDLLNSVVDWFKSIPEKIITVGRNIVIGLWNGITEKWEWLKEKFHGILGYFSDAANEFKEGFKVGYEEVKGYATGGFPTRGDYFLANENGVPEYVGSIGGKTAVANTNQIVEGIALGVKRAFMESDSLQRENNAILKGILNKSSDIYMDGRKVNDALNKSQNARGYNPIGGNYAYGL